MFTLFRLLLNPVGVIILGVVACASGFLIFQDGTQAVPERSELVGVAGTVKRIVKTWSYSKRDPSAISSVRYELELADPGRPPVVLDIPEADLRAIPWPAAKPGAVQNTANAGGAFESGERAEALMGKPITALVLRKKFSDQKARDPWELSAGGIMLVSYEKSRERQIEHWAGERKNGPYIAGAGGAMVLLGGWWFVRRRRS